MIIKSHHEINNHYLQLQILSFDMVSYSSYNFFLSFLIFVFSNDET